MLLFFKFYCYSTLNLKLNKVRKLLLSQSPDRRKEYYSFSNFLTNLLNIFYFSTKCNNINNNSKNNNSNNIVMPTRQYRLCCFSLSGLGHRRATGTTCRRCLTQLYKIDPVSDGIRVLKLTKVCGCVGVLFYGHRRDMSISGSRGTRPRLTAPRRLLPLRERAYARRGCWQRHPCYTTTIFRAKWSRYFTIEDTSSQVAKKIPWWGKKGAYFFSEEYYNDFFEGVALYNNVGVVLEIIIIWDPWDHWEIMNNYCIMV